MPKRSPKPLAWKATISAAPTKRSSTSGLPRSKEINVQAGAVLGLPLFDQEHRAHGAALERWLSDRTESDDEGDACASVRAWVRALAGGGWLRACVTGFYGGLRAEIDVRTLCLTRELLAYRSALAD